MDVRRGRFEAEPADDFGSGSVDDAIVRQRVLRLGKVVESSSGFEGVRERDPVGHPSCYGVVVQGRGEGREVLQGERADEVGRGGYDRTGSGGDGGGRGGGGGHGTFYRYVLLGVEVSRLRGCEGFQVAGL